MPKYTVYGSDVTFYRAEVEADSIQDIYERAASEDFDWSEYDGEAIEISKIELNGVRVDE